MQPALRRLADHPLFNNTMTLAIVVAGVVIGMETSPALVEQFDGWLRIINLVVVALFALECAVKIGAEWPTPQTYFKDPWNAFDFAIVVSALMPFSSASVGVLRLVRILRFLRLVRALPRLQILVGALLNSLPSMAYVGLLLTVLFYVYAVAGVMIFSTNDPRHFGSLPLAFLSLFQVVTGDAWSDIMYINLRGCDVAGFEVPCPTPEAHPLAATLYFVSFVLIGAMVMLNLFIGVIMQGMEEAKQENRDLDRAEGIGNPLPDDIEALEADLKRLSARLAEIKHRVKESGAS